MLGPVWQHFPNSAPRENQGNTAPLRPGSAPPAPSLLHCRWGVEKNPFPTPAPSLPLVKEASSPQGPSFAPRLSAYTLSAVELEPEPTKKRCQTVFFRVRSERSWKQGKQELERLGAEGEHYQTGPCSLHSKLQFTLVVS